MYKKIGHQGRPTDKEMYECNVKNILLKQKNIKS